MLAGMRAAAETLYIGRMDVVEYRLMENEKTGISRHQEVVVLENIPCRLSYGKAAAVTDGSAAENVQEIRVYFAPDIAVLPGSKLCIRQNGMEAAYKSSGVPKCYASHNEVTLEYFERWA